MNNDIHHVRAKLVAGLRAVPEFDFLTFDELFVHVNDTVLDENDHAVLNAFAERIGEEAALKWYEEIFVETGQGKWYAPVTAAVS